MKKKILFIMNGLECGGAEKSLLSLLENIDYSKYDVDLYLFRHGGSFMDSIPKEVNLLPENKGYKYYDMPFFEAIKALIKERKFKSAINRAIVGCIFKKEKNTSIVEQKIWKFTKTSLYRPNENYDVAIGFMERSPIYFCVDNVKSDKKIGWIHTDYNKLGLDKNMDAKYIYKLDNLITISDNCADVLMNYFDKNKIKINVIQNIVSKKTIDKLADENINFNNCKNKYVSIVSVGRVEPEKGFDLAVEACKILKDRGLNIVWNIVGDGTQKNNLIDLAKKYGVQDNFNILGIKENPYPYIKKSDIYVQPSRYEGKSIALEEAKILKKPIVVTNFNTAKYQIKDNVTGIITDMTATSLADGIELLINDKDLFKALGKNLLKEKIGNEDEIYKLYELL